MKQTKIFTVQFTGIASFAQERIFLDEQVRFSSQIAIYNEVTALRVVRGSLSLDRLSQAVRSVLNKHKILRTSLIYNDDDGTLHQFITNKHNTFIITAEQTFASDDELQNIIYQITINPNLFDLSNGRVFHCQILRHQMGSNENTNKEFITNPDVLIIAFHHAAFDRSSFPIFLNDLWYACTSTTAWCDDDESLQYIDYTVCERIMDMRASREFWHMQLEGYNLECGLSLPVDRHRLSSDHRSGVASVVQISFDQEISTSFLNYSSAHQATPFQLGLATFYAFLYRLSHGQTVLCISCLNANRYRSELQNIIGMFVSTLPYPVELDSDWSFDGLVQHVQEKCLAILEHSHYPLQNILADFHLNQSTVPFLDILFDFITISSNIDQLSVDAATLEQLSFRQPSEVAKFDFMLTFVYNPTSNDNKLSFHLCNSRDLFNETTIAIIGQRFKHLFEQFLLSTSSLNQTDTSISLISKLDLILPEEFNEVEDIVFYRQLNVIDEGMFIH